MEQAVSTPDPKSQNKKGGLALGSMLRAMIQGLAVPALAVLTAVLIGSVLILLSGNDPLRAYQGLIRGSFGTDGALTLTLIKMTPLILSGLAVAFAFKGGLFNIGAQGQLAMGSMMAAWVGFSPSTGVRLVSGFIAIVLLNSLITRIIKRLPIRNMPQLGSILILVGVILVGGLIGILVGNSIPTENIHPLFHITLALLAGVGGGATIAFVPGLLKANTGAHEVITTIMLNYIGQLLLEWLVSPVRRVSSNIAVDFPRQIVELVNDTIPAATRFLTNFAVHGIQPGGPLAACQDAAQICTGNPNRSPNILPSAFLPTIYQPGRPAPDPLHLGVFVAIMVAILVWVVLYKTTFGFELRMAGTNPGAARYSGIKVARMIVLTMVIAGSLAGMAGAIQTMGVGVGDIRNFQTNQNLALGFDSIAVALLAGSNPLAIIPSAFLFGALDAGSTTMQFDSGVPKEIIQVIQAMILMFVAADQIIRWLYRIKASGGDARVKLSSNWGKR